MLMWLGLHWIDWIVLCSYLIGILAIGLWSYRQVHDMDDFFMGGRRFGKVFMMFFAFGSGTSSEQAVSVAAGSFRVGLAGIWYQFLWLWATPFYWILAPVFRRLRALTTSDFFEARYDRSTALLYSILGICMSIVFMAAALFFGARMVEGMTGGEFRTQYAIAAMVIMFVLYGMAGGLGAAVVTDFVQGILTVIFSFLLLPFALYYAAQVTGAANGFVALHQGVPGRSGEALLSLTLTQELATKMGQEPITWFYVIMLSINALVAIVCQPHIMGVCGAGKTEFEGRFGFTAGNFLKRLCTIAWTFTGLSCVIIYLTPGSPFISQEQYEALTSDPLAMKSFADMVFGVAAHDILPRIAPGLIGLLFAALLAAIMSSCDAQMVVASGLFTENIYKRYLNRNASERHYLWVGRFAGLTIVALSLLVMSQFSDAIQVLNTYVNAIPAFIGLAFWFGIIWRGYTPAAVWASTLTTLTVWYLTQTHAPSAVLQSLGDGPFWQENIDYLPSRFRNWLWGVMPYTQYGGRTSIPWQYVLYLSSGATVGILVSLITRRPSPEKLDHFYRLIRTPIRPGEEVASPCTLPENPLPMETGKLIRLPGIEIPRPSRVGLIGFLVAWAMVGGILWLTQALASLGS
ncbi:MAG: sodium:solute symporter family protein [Planctomycetaceae bacterium]|nr:sodium:solute symporter family protein [Planctomycetaceae bacterium]